MPEEHIVQKSSFYATKPAYLSRLRYAKTLLNNTSASSVTTGLTSTAQLEWKIPANTVFNLSKSYISYQYTVPALASNYGVVFEHGCDLASSTTFSDGGGLNIVDINYFDRFIDVMRPIMTDEKTFMTQDQNTQLYKCNQLTTSNVLPFSRDGLLNGTLNASTDNYVEPQHLIVGSAVNTAVNVTRQFYLGAAKGTFYGMDKNFAFGRDMYLRFYTNYAQRMFGYTTNPANITAANWTATQTAPTLQNVFLYLAIEQSEVLRDSVLRHLRDGGLKITIPYTYMYRNSSSASQTVFNASQTMTRQLGRRLKRITYATYNALENGSPFCYDRSNVNGTKVMSIQTTMDSRPLTDYLLNCYNPNSSINPGNQWGNTFGSVSNISDDYREATKFIKGSVIQSYPMYQTMWFYQDSWGVTDFLDQSISNIPEENIDDGFSLLDGEHTYALQATLNFIPQGTSNCTSGLIHYLIFNYIRTLHSTVGGIDFSA